MLCIGEVCLGRAREMHAAGVRVVDEAPLADAEALQC